MGLSVASAYRVRQVDAHGVVTWVFHQSDLNNFFLCPERARRDWLGELDRVETDATAIGTSVHLGIEHFVMGASYRDSVTAALGQWAELEPEVTYVQVMRTETAEAKIVDCLDKFMVDIWPGLPQVVAVEHKFSVPLGFRPNGEQIRMEGAMDALDELGDVWDWKSANRPYEQWECDRFKIQPSVYCHARWVETGEVPDFHYGVMSKSNRGTQVLTVRRTQAHFAWVEEQVQRICDLIEAELAGWPLNDQGWHCSPKWCPAWHDCKGALL